MIALSKCVRTIIALRSKLDTMGEIQSPETTVYVANQAVIHLAHRPSNGPRSKHFGIRLQFIREHVYRGTVRVTCIGTDRDVSDLLTKVLSAEKTSRPFRDTNGGVMPIQVE